MIEWMAQAALLSEANTVKKNKSPAVTSLFKGNNTTL